MQIAGIDIYLRTSARIAGITTAVNITTNGNLCLRRNSNEEQQYAYYGTLIFQFSILNSQF
jgi:hypothetical protein